MRHTLSGRRGERLVEGMCCEGRSGSRGRGRRTRFATKKHTQRTKRTTVIIETQGRGPKRTIVYEDVYEQEE